MSLIRTVVADGNEIFRHGICSILTDGEYFDICGETDNGALVLTMFESVEPQLCIFSFDLPEMDGVVIARKIKERYPTANILLLSGKTDQYLLTEFLDSGSDGLLHKSAHRLDLLDAAHKVAKGERYLGKHFSRMMTTEYLRMAKTKTDTTPKITNREREVLVLLTKGNTSSEIADKLFISTRTVEKHRTNLLKKLNQRNTASLVRFALEHDAVLS
ncbi:MAG: response regulator transcription factor [Bacteroidota bacterium]